MSDIPAVKVIYANTYRIDERSSEDPKEYPFKLYANFRHSEFMIVTATMLYGGSEEFILRAKTREALELAVKENEWADHPRLRRIVLTTPDGKDELLYGTSAHGKSS